MTLASRITLTRMALVPVFAAFSLRYSLTVLHGRPQESLRWTAIALFIIASATDGLDGWVARRFHQQSRFGAFIDPFADKVLLLTAIIFLSAFPWHPSGSGIPAWFVALVILRDLIIIGGIIVIRKASRRVHYQPHWTGKVCTVTQMVVLGWAMFRIDLAPLLLPCLIAATFLLASGTQYILEGWRQLHSPPDPAPGT